MAFNGLSKGIVIMELSLKKPANLKKSRYKKYNNSILHLMLLPGVVFIILFSYIPLMGSVMAFQNFRPTLGIFGSAWVGLDNFRFVARIPGSFRILWNTVYIASAKLVLHIIVALTFALLLNELRSKRAKRVVQTFIYMPHFLSWVILSGIFIDILSPSTGAVNMFLQRLGIEPIFFLGDTFWFPITMIVTDVWKGFGFGTIIYLAAITSINPNLYEAASIDGAGRIKQTIHVTIPGMMPIIMLMAVLSLGNILNAGFDQIFNMYSPLVYETGDIIDTFVFRLGIQQQQFAAATAVGLMRSVVSFFFVSLAYWIAYRFVGYRIF